MSAARKPKAFRMLKFKESTGDPVMVHAMGSVVRVVCLRDDRPGGRYVPLLLTPAQARRVARALLRFADGAR